MTEHYSGKLVWKLDNGHHPESPWLVDHEDDHNASWFGISTEDGRIVALLVNDDEKRPLASQEVEMDENARRLAACWNACEGLPTEMLEGASGSYVLNHFTQKTIGDLKQQRGALLAALEQCAASMDGDKLYVNTLAYAQRAIAAAKGGAV